MLPAEERGEDSLPLGPPGSPARWLITVRSSPGFGQDGSLTRRPSGTSSGWMPSTSSSRVWLLTGRGLTGSAHLGHCHLRGLRTQSASIGRIGWIVIEKGFSQRRRKCLKLNALSPCAATLSGPFSPLYFTSTRTCDPRGLTKISRRSTPRIRPHRSGQTDGGWVAVPLSRSSAGRLAG
jgi:hypothetical protein